MVNSKLPEKVHPDRAEWAKDQIYSDVDVYLGYTDRLRVLVGFTINVKVYTNCENEVGRAKSESRIVMRKPSWWPKGRQRIYIHEGKNGK